MSQQHPMAMGGMGGPVAPPANAGTPTNSAAAFSPDAIIKKLNTAIYDYLLCNEKYDVARAFHKEMQCEYSADIKQSPNQRGGQPNGVDNSMDVDSKEHVGIQKRPNDLPAPHSLSSEDSPFLQDWWCQFWELYQGNRQKGKPTTLSYIGTQRQAMKARAGMVAGVDANGVRGAYGMMNNGMPGGDLRAQAMKNGMTQQQIQAMKMRASGQQSQVQGGNEMQRTGSQMNMSDPRSGSPNTGGDAPSPKRQRIDGNGNMQHMNQARAGMAQQMQGGNQSVEVYSQAMQQQMQNAIQRASASSNANKGMPPNPAAGPGGAQSSPMAQQSMDGNSGEFQYNRMGMPQNGVAPAPAASQQGQATNGGGNHALQDYQMQLMLLEQQNKKRLLMARQEQDSRVGSQEPGQPGMMDPNNPQGQMRPGQMMMGPNGQPMMRPPSSHPMAGMNPQQLEQLRQAQMMNSQQQFVGQPPPGQMMPGQQPPQQQQGGPPGPPGPNMTPRPGNMAPPPAPANPQTGGTQPSSPAQPPAPPTPSQANKPKPGGNKKADNKKGGANQKKEGPTENAPPTPTPPPSATPNQTSFQQNKNVPVQNGQPNQGQQPNQQQQNGVQPPAPDMSNVAPFSHLDGTDQFNTMDFATLDSGDVLDNFDFDSFLNNTGGDDGGLGFDANFAFGDGGIEADIGGN